MSEYTLSDISYQEIKTLESQFNLNDQNILLIKLQILFSMLFLLNSRNLKEYYLFVTQDQMVLMVSIVHVNLS